MRIIYQDCYKTLRSLSSIFLADHVMQQGQKSTVQTNRPETVLVVVASLCAYFNITFCLFSESVHASEMMGAAVASTALKDRLSQWAEWRLGQLCPGSRACPEVLAKAAQLTWQQARKSRHRSGPAMLTTVRHSPVITGQLQGDHSRSKVKPQNQQGPSAMYTESLQVWDTYTYTHITKNSLYADLKEKSNYFMSDDSLN